MAERLRVAFVVVRSGEGIYGGAEGLTLELARRLTAHCEVTVLTSCARDYRTWENAFAPGASTLEGIPVVRFPVDRPRDPQHFNALCERIAGDPRNAEREIEREWAAEQGPRVTGLEAHLRSENGKYDVVYFMSYLYATTYLAIGAAGDRAILMPLAHDEWMLNVPFYQAVFSSAARFAFLSPEEEALIRRRFPRLTTPGRVVGIGIDVPAAPSGERFRQAYGFGPERLLVYVGRVEPAKGVDSLLEHFTALSLADPRPRKLVLVGPVDMAIPNHPNIRAVGAVDEATKYDALAAAEAVVIPSTLESLSMAALEALGSGTPIVVNGASDVLIGHCRRSNAGLWYARRDEFIEIVRSDFCGAREQLGERGRAFVARHYSWPGSIDAHLALIDETLAMRREHAEGER